MGLGPTDLAPNKIPLGIESIEKASFILVKFEFTVCIIYIYVVY